MKNKTKQNYRSRNQRYWQAHVKAQKQSGLNRTEYCRQHKLSYHVMTYWHKKLYQPSSKKSTLVPVPFHSITLPSPVQADSSALKIILPGNLSVEVGDDFSPTTLVKLLATLEGR